jgi:pyruvate formate lyase activating enzyme
MKFGGLYKSSLIDFPDRIASVLFTVGCNLRCPFCHNWRLVLNPQGPFISESTIFQILESRKQYIDAVVITGGEPTLHLDLPSFLKKLKARDFIIKLDTNGFFPEILTECLPYVDYIALDIKTSLERFNLLKAKNINPFLQSLNLLKRDVVDYEFRSTAVPGFIEENDIPDIGKLVHGAKRFVFQQFVPGDTLDQKFNMVPYSLIILSQFASMMQKYVDEVIIRD